MKNTIRTTSIDLANNLSIDHATKTITVSKQLHKASSRYGSDEYKLFEELMTKNQGYQVVVKTQAKRKTLRITFDFMTKYISKHDKNGEKMNELLIKRGLKANENNEFVSESFPEIRSWFLEEYPEVKELGTRAA